MLTAPGRASTTSYTSGAGEPSRPPSSAMWWTVAGLLVLTLLAPLITTGALLWSVLYAPLTTALPKARTGIDAQITRVYDSRGGQIATLHRFETHIPVSPGDVPKALKDAVVAVEDKRFYSHKGVDFQALIRALKADIEGGGYVEGASTITQQYVKLAYTTGERTLNRKLREVVLAGRLDRKLSKDEILYRYLSNVYFGSGAYGVGAAAETYFRKPAKDLTLSEAALLAGLIRQPSTNEPRSNPTGAESRRRLVLQKMLEQRLVSDGEHRAALGQHLTLQSEVADPYGPATLVYPPEQQEAQYPYFVDYVRRYLIAKYGDTKVYREGLRVETTIDPALQAKADEAVSATLEGTTSPLEMSLVTMEPATGYVRALVGGRDFAKSQVNLALGNCSSVAKSDDTSGPICIDGGGTGRQPGSSFKPFTLAKAFEEGIQPSKVYSGPSTYRFPNCAGEGCTVHNAEGGGYGSLDLAQATTHSVNTVYAQLIQDVGVKETADMAHRLGITMVNPEGTLPSGEPYGPSLTLGAAEASPLDMAAAYGVFANRGVQFPATPVLKVIDAKGKVLEDNTKRDGKRVLAQGIADNVNEILKGVLTSGTGTAADVGRPGGTAGKTGTSEVYSDAWFIGYTPHLSTSVWMGYANSRNPLTNIKGVGKVFGGTFPAQTWHAYMTKVLENAPPDDFPPPAPLPNLPSTTTTAPLFTGGPPETVVVVPYEPPPTVITVPPQQLYPALTVPPYPQAPTTVRPNAPPSSLPPRTSTTVPSLLGPH
ncbi:MAG TPA: transglycosylase domain-containing protein [Acidimicrobiales bacterium]|nr:transglycosylase domain-containing protein [Acidimicrobiales bacterium]